MTGPSSRRALVLVPIVLITTILGVGCTIPTEDQPQPVNREQTSTTVPTNP